MCCSQSLHGGPTSFIGHDPTSSQVVAKPASSCLYKYGFESFTVQLCRLNISYTVFGCMCACVAHFTSQPQSDLPTMLRTGWIEAGGLLVKCSKVISRLARRLSFQLNSAINAALLPEMFMRLDISVRKKRQQKMKWEREKKREWKQSGFFPFSLFPHPPPLASVVTSDFRSKESDVTEMELLRRCFFSLLHITLREFYCNRAFRQWK